MMTLQPGVDLPSIAKLFVPSAVPALQWRHDLELLLLSLSPAQPDLPPLAHSQSQRADARPQEAEISTLDWNLLLDAVKDRLRQVAGTPTEPLQAADLAGDMALRLQSTVLECVDALNLLQMSLLHAQGRRAYLEDGLRVTQSR